MASNPQTTVLYTVGTSVGIVYVARLVSSPGDVLRQPGEMIRIALGGSLVIVGLMLAAEWNGDFAKGFAWLVLVGSVLTYGGKAFEAVSKTTKNRSIGSKVVGSTGAAIGSGLSGLSGQIVNTIGKEANK